MRVSIIVAMGVNRQIGLGGKLPWHIASDLKNFKKITMGHTLIFGRKTFESIGKALPGRKTIVITRDPNYAAPGCTVATSLMDALDQAEAAGESEAFIAGGSEIYSLGLPHATRVHLTRVHYDGDADTFFPEFTAQGWTRSFSNFSPGENGEPSWLYEIWDKED